MAQSVKRLTLEISSGLDPRVVSLSPALRSMLSVEPASDSLSLLSPPLMLSLSL